MRQAGVDVGTVHHHTVPACVGDQRLRRVEPHRLCPQQCGTERRRVVQLEPGRIEHQRREAQRVTLGKTEIGEGFQLLVDPVGKFTGDSVLLAQTGVEPSAQPAHLLRRPLGAHGPAQLIRLGGGKPGAVDRQLHQLLLKQRHTQCFSQRRLHRGVVVDNRVQTVAPPYVGMHRSALDGTRPDQGHLDDEVVEHPRFQPRQRCHLRA